MRFKPHRLLYREFALFGEIAKLGWPIKKVTQKFSGSFRRKVAGQSNSR
jgi:hypothetical protein